jgi:DNA-binding SARP family transcriptional activator
VEIAHPRSAAVWLASVSRSASVLALLVPVIELRVLGRLDLAGVSPEAANTLLAQPRPGALLVYLALRDRGEFVRRDRAVALFWPETDQGHARSNLRKLVFTLRRTLGEVVIEARGDEDIRLAPGSVWCDGAEFLEAVRSGRLSRAVELYRGPLLPGFTVPVAGGFQEWLEQSRRHLGREAVKAALQLAERHWANQERTEVGDLVQFVRQLDAELEDEYQLRKIMDLLDRVGDRATALSIYEDVRQRLWRDFRALPSPETRALVERLRSG